MDYKPTLNLPVTNFPMKADLPNREGLFLKKWEEGALYGKIREAMKGKKKGESFTVKTPTGPVKYKIVHIA